MQEAGRIPTEGSVYVQRGRKELTPRLEVSLIQHMSGLYKCSMFHCEICLDLKDAYFALDSSPRSEKESVWKHKPWLTRCFKFSLRNRCWSYISRPGK